MTHNKAALIIAITILVVLILILILTKPSPTRISAETSSPVKHIADINKKVLPTAPWRRQAKVVRMRVTAYCPCEKCCGNWSDGVTASGVPAEGLIIAAPKTFKFGTQMYIKGYGLATVQDRGGAIKGNRLDVLFPTHQEALEWGVKDIGVIIYPDTVPLESRLTASP